MNIPFLGRNHYFIIMAVFWFIPISCAKKIVDLDILIENGTVFNGVDSIPRLQSVGIKDGKIVFIGNTADGKVKAGKTINAQNLIVCPGFIDPHTHADKDLASKKTAHNLPFLKQGVTTVVVGNDGRSLFPIKKYRDIYQQNGLGTNVAFLTGHGTLRSESMGDSDKDPTPSEMEQMKTLLQNEMDAGAIGISTGLFYKPGSYSKTDEIIQLAKIVAQNKGIYDTHLRDEGTFSVGLVPAIEEAIQIGEAAKIPIHISHIKCLGVDVWGQSDTIIHLIDEGRARGLNITANQYPYEASATGLQAAVVPRWAESGGKDSLYHRYDIPELREKMLYDTEQNINRRGGADKLLIVQAQDSLLIGKTLLAISEAKNLAPGHTVFEILKNNTVKVASFNMTLSDIANFMKKDWVVTGSDGGSGHPRKYGSFARKYRKYVIGENIIPLHGFINNSSSKTAEILQLPLRGKLKEGYYADIIIFNPETFSDKADYINAYAHSQGLIYSIVNGKVCIDNGIYTQNRNGKVLTLKEF